MSRCSACGAHVRPDTRFCTSCGAPHSQADELGFVCPECHQFNDAGAKTCRSCGSSLVPSGFTGFLRAANIATPGASEDERVPMGGPAASEPGAAGSSSAGESGPSTEGKPESTAVAGSAAAAGEVEPPSEAGSAVLPPSEIDTDPAAPSLDENESGPSFPAGLTRPNPPAATQAMPAVRSAPGPGTLAFGPLQPGRAKLLVVRGRCFQGSEVRLNTTEVAAGRSVGVLVFPDDPFLADRHATFIYSDGHLCLRDEGGPGGSWLRIREPVALRANAEIAVGDTRLAIREPARPPSGPFIPYGAPRAEGSFRVEERLEGDRPGRAWICSGEVVTIGSSSAAVTIPGDPLVAHRHAEIRRVGPRWLIADCGSPEGTFVRVAPGIQVPLRNGDRVRIGSEILEIRVAA